MQPKDPVPDDPDLAELLAHLCAAWDQEKRELARQMHDNLGSTLTALSMHLGLLQRHLPADPALQERAATMKQLLSQVVQTNRALQDSLWNDKLEYLGLKAALQDLAEQFYGRHQRRLLLSLPEHEVACPAAIGLTLLRCAEEGARNAMRHARAQAISIVLDDEGEQLCLTVRDDGVGVDGARPGLGLRLLRQRVRQLGGSMELDNAPGGGGALRVRVPRPASV
ncbi:sensor histidine kinase [Massilia sp. TS11]|uniref:sensor histidine kinase n=1 Tax=Massilia sp. TS11 TaxID=2908003 RepID=UPI001EDAC98B|nr:histidine kinase [Massilia sp. TS11]MCG2584123.1 histidine kinase [Massilia sp. TS11]